MKAFYLILIFTLYFNHTVLSQNPLQVVSRYTTDNGLPQNSVKSIAFDRWGFCWLATEMGLVRYDGKIFTSFGMAEIKGLRSERMLQINFDDRNNLYVLVDGDQFLKITTGASMSMPSPRLMNEHTALASDYGFDTGDHEALAVLRRFYLGWEELQNLNTPSFSNFLNTSCLSKNDLYFHTTLNLRYFSGNEKPLRTLRRYAKNEKRQYISLDKHLFISIAVGNNVEAWDHGRLQSQFTRIQGSLEKEKSFLTGDFQCFTSQSGSFIYTNNNLHALSTAYGKITSKKVLHGVNVPALNCVFFDPWQNKYYLGSGTEGLTVIQKSQFEHPSFPEKIRDYGSYSQAKINDSTIFSNDLIMGHKRVPTVLGLRVEMRAGVDVSGDGKIYFQKGTLGLARYDLKKRKLRDLRPLDRQLIYFRVDKAKQNSYVFFTRNTFGKVTHDSLVRVLTFPHPSQIASVAPLLPGHYLVGTRDGLKWYDTSNNHIYKSVLDSLLVTAIFPEKNGNVWISTYGKGFYLFKGNKIYAMPFGPKQALKTVHSFIDDGHGFFWLPTNNGLFKVRKTDLVAYALGKTNNVFFFRFDRADGLRTNEFNGGCDPSYLWLKDSLLSISSLKGPLWFYPNKLFVAIPDKPIYVDSITVDNKPFKIEEAGIELRPDFSRMSLNVSSPYFGNPINLNLEYRLDGIDPQWHTVGDRGTFAINNLPTGEYRIFFRRNGNGLEHGLHQISIPLKVTPWFYNTWWFYTLLTFSILTAVHLIYKRRLRVLKEKSDELEKIVYSRTEDLNEAVEDLAKSEMALLESNRFKDHMITMVLHDLRSPIRFLSLASGKLLKNYELLGADDIRESLSQLVLGTQNLWGFTEQFFFWITTQQEGVEIKHSPFALQELFDEIAGLYNEILKINRNSLEIMATDLWSYTDYQVLSVIIRNLIDNANKNTSDGVITLSSYYLGTTVAISVSDSGMGLTQNQIDMFMDRDRAIGRQGAGSILIHRMLDQINGVLSIRSEVEKGSTFTISFQNPKESHIAGLDGSVQ